MQKPALFLLILLFLSCKKPRVYTLEDFQNMNGYWEITEVIYPNGEKKEYKANTTIDFIELNGEKGYKKKVYPKLDGTYLGSNDVVPFRIVKKANKGYFLSYNDSINGWQESINFLGVDYFSLKSSDGLIYCYDRYQPLELDIE